ncbi:hypothetical protein RNZ50_15625 [Paracoccaceae bacterium Fryx2]|nr:hypothetical protein [Paracoccaceae bacterium Fryx2]
MTHWAAEYIGAEWTRAETCWHFAARIWREQYGVRVPLVPIDGANARATRRMLDGSPERAAWAAVAVPMEGDAVLMAKGAHPCHVGVWITPPEGPGVLHSVEGSGGIFTPLGALAAMGYRVAGYYRRVAG